MPTDTVYGLTCGITHHDAIQRIYKLKDMDAKKPLSILVGDMSMIGRYAKGVSTPAFRLLKRVLPGPYTFIFEASPEVPKIMLRKRRTVGIRMPDNPIALALLQELNEPLLSSSIRDPELDFVNDPEEIERLVRKQSGDGDRRRDSVAGPINCRRPVRERAGSPPRWQRRCRRPSSFSTDPRLAPASTTTGESLLRQSLFNHPSNCVCHNLRAVPPSPCCLAAPPEFTRRLGVGEQPTVASTHASAPSATETASSAPSARPSAAQGWATTGTSAAIASSTFIGTPDPLLIGAIAVRADCRNTLRSGTSPWTSTPGRSCSF